VDSIRAAILMDARGQTPTTPSPCCCTRLTELGAPPVVDVDGAATYPQTPSVKAHWEPFDVPEPQT